MQNSKIFYKSITSQQTPTEFLQQIDGVLPTYQGFIDINDRHVSLEARLHRLEALKQERKTLLNDFAAQDLKRIKAIEAECNYYLQHNLHDINTKQLPQVLLGATIPNFHQPAGPGNSWIQATTLSSPVVTTDEIKKIAEIFTSMQTANFIEVLRQRYNNGENRESITKGIAKIENICLETNNLFENKLDDLRNSPRTAINNPHAVAETIEKQYTKAIKELRSLNLGNFHEELHSEIAKLEKDLTTAYSTIINELNLQQRNYVATIADLAQMAEHPPLGRNQYFLTKNDLGKFELYQRNILGHLDRIELNQVPRLEQTLDPFRATKIKDISETALDGINRLIMDYARVEKAQAQAKTEADLRSLGLFSVNKTEIPNKHNEKINEIYAHYHQVVHTGEYQDKLQKKLTALYAANPHDPHAQQTLLQEMQLEASNKAFAQWQVTKDKQWQEVCNLEAQQAENAAKRVAQKNFEMHYRSTIAPALNGEFNSTNNFTVGNQTTTDFSALLDKEKYHLTPRDSFIEMEVTKGKGEMDGSLTIKINSMIPESFRQVVPGGFDYFRSIDTPAEKVATVIGTTLTNPLATLFAPILCGVESIWKSTKKSEMTQSFEGLKAYLAAVKANNPNETLVVTTSSRPTNEEKLYATATIIWARDLPLKVHCPQQLRLTDEKIRQFHKDVKAYGIESKDPNDPKTRFFSPVDSYQRAQMANAKHLEADLAHEARSTQAPGDLAAVAINPIR